MCRIIDAFPDEITLNILRRLPLADLVIWYTIKRPLKATLDEDEQLSKKKFRIPKRHDIDEAKRVAWVRDQWTELHAKMQPNETSENSFRSHIQVNPLVLPSKRRLKRTATADQGAAGYEISCFTGQKIVYEVPGNSNLTSFQAGLARHLIESMFVAYPPTTHITIQDGRNAYVGSMIPRSRPVHPFEISTFVHTGFTVKQLVALRLWQMHHEISVEEDESEGSDDEEVGGDISAAEDGDEDEGPYEPSIEESEDEGDSDDGSDSEYMPEDADDDSNGGDT